MILAGAIVLCNSVLLTYYINNGKCRDNLLDKKCTILMVDILPSDLI
jgi:hypothetical protein